MWFCAKQTKKNYWEYFYSIVSDWMSKLKKMLFVVFIFENLSIYVWRTETLWWALKPCIGVLNKKRDENFSRPLPALEFWVQTSTGWSCHRGSFIAKTFHGDNSVHGKIMAYKRRQKSRKTRMEAHSKMMHKMSFMWKKNVTWFLNENDTCT